MSLPITRPPGVVAVTGRRGDVPPFQRSALFHVLALLYDAGARELHHGMCTGWDEMAHLFLVTVNTVHELGPIPGWQIHGHPGVTRDDQARWRMPVDSPGDFTTVALDLPYLERNQVMATVADTLVAGPAFPEQHIRSRRSGTWATIRMARDLGRQIVYVLPDGRITGKAPE